MKILWPIALITFKEGIRSRVFYSISVVALLSVAVNLLISSMIPQDVGKVAVEMALSAVSFTGLLLVLFISINIVAKDLEKRTIYMVLSRPISREQYVLGKFLGMTLLILISLCILGTFACIALLVIKGLYAVYFQNFSWPLFFLALFFNMLMLILLTALTFLFSSFSTSAFTTLMLSIISYIIGQSLSDVKKIVETSQAVGIEVSPIIEKIVKTMYYVFPNLSLFDIKTQAAHSISISRSYIFWVVSYGMIYTALIVFLAAYTFRKREMY